MSLCPSTQFTLPQAILAGNCFQKNCGQFEQIYKQAPSVYLCCREGFLYPNAATIIVYIIIMPIIGIGSLGALGGGVVKRPFLEATLNYDANNAGNITACLMFGAQLVNQIIISFQRHPYYPQRPNVNYEIGMIYALAIPISMQFGQELAGYMPLLPVLTLQMLFFIVTLPILLLFAKRQEVVEQEMDENYTESHVSMTSAFKGSIQDEAQLAIIFKQFLEESHNRFPLIPILITFGSFAINESIILARTTSFMQSPYFNDDSKHSGRGTIGNIWNLYMMILLFAVNILMVMITLYFYQQKEELKDVVKFKVKERYFTPSKRFFKIYAAGWATGFVAGFLGMAAGLTMFVTMVEFGLVAASAGATANYGYFIVCLQVFVQLLVGDGLDIGYQFFFYGLGMISVLVFTLLGYYFLNKYKIGHVLFYIDFAIVILNMAGNIALGIQQSDRWGYQSIEQNYYANCPS